MKNFWETYPRQLAYPSRIFCRNAGDFMRTYNKLNGSVNKLYVSLYKYGENKLMESVEIDVVGLDMDSEVCYDTMKEVHTKLVNNNIRHQVLFSTRGFWIFAYAKPTSYPKHVARGKIAAMQDDLLEGTTAYFGKAADAPVDNSIRGDAERLCRMPSSYDKGRDRYAILLSEADIALGYDGIVNLSATCDEKRRFQIFTFCKNGTLMDPEKYESKSVNGGTMDFDGEEFDYKVPENLEDFNKNLFNILPKMIQKWVGVYELCTWEARFYTVLYMRESGYSRSIINNFLKSFYINYPRTDQYKNHYEHLCGVKAIDLAFNRPDLKFPNYKKVMELGLCSVETAEKEGLYNSAVYKKVGK
ncbi:MAG: hypothetical protein D4S01_08830 [Dehalococcoidia bacterium]|nr:MAG: hypothetical protein D4S01_08830 [Dehalococcoidia bacterium]